MGAPRARWPGEHGERGEHEHREHEEHGGRSRPPPGFLGAGGALASGRHAVQRLSVRHRCSLRTLGLELQTHACGSGSGGASGQLLPPGAGRTAGLRPLLGRGWPCLRHPAAVLLRGRQSYSLATGAVTLFPDKVALGRRDLEFQRLFSCLQLGFLSCFHVPHPTPGNPRKPLLPPLPDT